MFTFGEKQVIFTLRSKYKFFQPLAPQIRQFGPFFKKF